MVQPNDGHEIRIPPSRLDPLRAKLEAGDDLTEADLARAAQLQALDVVEMGRNYVLGEFWCWNEMLQIDEALQKQTKLRTLEMAGVDVSGNNQGE